MKCLSSVTSVRLLLYACAAIIRSDAGSGLPSFLRDICHLMASL